jgi:peptidylprolyl isomerase
LELDHIMKHTALILLLAACTVAASAQSPTKPASTAKPATTVAKSATKAAKLAVAADKLPPGVPVVKGIKNTLYTVSLRYQEIKIGDGAPAQTGKLLGFYFTLWSASDGHKIDSSDDHRVPLLDKDKKPVTDADGKPKLGDPQKGMLLMGNGRPLPGWNMGFEGMKAGGKRRVFIPWQLGVGDQEIPARDATHPALPAKSDLILDIELVEVADIPKPPARSAMMPGGHPLLAPRPSAPVAPAAAAKPAAPTPSATSAVPNAAPAPAAPSTSAQPQTK